MHAIESSLLRVKPHDHRHIDDTDVGRDVGAKRTERHDDAVVESGERSARDPHRARSTVLVDHEPGRDGDRG